MAISVLGREKAFEVTNRPCKFPYLQLSNDDGGSRSGMWNDGVMVWLQ